MDIIIIENYKVFHVRRLGVVGRYLAFYRGVPGTISSGGQILISILGLGVFPLSVFCPV